jgi:hypothetical protein
MNEVEVNESVSCLGPRTSIPSNGAVGRFLFSGPRCSTDRADIVFNFFCCLLLLLGV